MRGSARGQHVLRTGSVLVLGIGLLLAGCAALGIPDHRATPSADDSAADVPHPTPTVLPVTDGTLAATGSFTGAATGRVELVREGGWWKLDLIDIALPDDRAYGLYLLSEPPATIECSDSYWAAAFGAVAAGTTGIELWPDPLFDDPSFLAGVLISPDPDPASPRDCADEERPVAGWAALEWALPELRADVQPSDLGVRSGARGKIEDGRYWIADGDVYDLIAERFGVTAEGLDYLNPVGTRTHRHDEIQAGCTLNVDKAHRGGTTRCRWDS